MSAARPHKLVLAVVDALKPEMLERAIEHGRAPALARVMERGTYVRDCVSAFPSVTPVAAASIATGLGPADHHHGDHFELIARAGNGRCGGNPEGADHARETREHRGRDEQPDLDGVGRHAANAVPR